MVQGSMRGFWSRALVGALVAASFALTPSCSGGAPGYCSQLCADYIACVDSGKYASGETTPFCGLEEPKRTTECQRACAAATEKLGESRGDFDTCASCVVKYVGKDACSDSETEKIGETSCADSCGTTKAGRAASLFREAFHADFDTLDQKTCTRALSLSFTGDHEKMGHDTGEAAGGGGWVGTCPSASGYIVYGPYVTLPPGKYRAGAKLVKTGTARPTDQVVVDVNSRNGGTLVEKRFEPPTSLPADVYFDLDLARTEEIAEVRVWISCDSSSTLAVTVQSVYLVR